jgi:hypothetical protein
MRWALIGAAAIVVVVAVAWSRRPVDLAGANLRDFFR